MIHEVKIHNGYAEWKEMSKAGINIPPLFGEYQHIFSSKKGKISLIHFNSLGEWLWEIHCLKGKLFEDCERFKTFQEAKKRCGELLTTGKGGK